MRSLALVFLCFCLAMGGTAAAMPMAGMAMEATHRSMTTDQDCPDMADVAAVSSADGKPVPVHGNPDCCRHGSCACAMAHFGIATRAPVLLSQPVSVTTTVRAIGSSGYSSPALARLARPPIA